MQSGNINKARISIHIEVYGNQIQKAYCDTMPEVSKTHQFYEYSCKSTLLQSTPNIYEHQCYQQNVESVHCTL